MGTVCCNCGMFHDSIECPFCGTTANERLTGLAALEGVTWDDLKDIKPIFDYGRLSPLEKVLFNDVYTWVGASTGGAVTTEVE